MAIKTTHYKQFLTLSAFSLAALLANGCENSKNVTNDSIHNSTTMTQASETKVAKNVILFVGDGMGISTITAGRIFDGQAEGKTGEEHQLAFDSFESVALIKTYNTNAQVPDSAGTATAIMSGYKTNIGTINVEPDKEFSGCGDISAKPTLAEIASSAGKAVGVISTARITHATPAAVFGHGDSRDWEADKDIPEKAAEAGCTGFAAQLVNGATPVNLALGGGAKEFSAEQFEAWNQQDESHVVARTGAEFSALNAADHQDVLGLFTKSHMSYEADRKEGEEPSLADMTSFAIDNLSARDTDGYVLMVEAGRIDHAHHGSNAYKALRDLQALNEAVKVAKAKSGDDTLILVTADHSHVFTMAGYPKRGNPILGLVVPPKSIEELSKGESRYILAGDGKPYTTLGYQNGSNVRTPDSPALTDNEVQAPGFRQQSAVPTGSETHAGEDVALFATGPGADKVRGVMEQNLIHNVMVDAMGIK